MSRASSASASLLARLKTITMQMQRPSIDLSLPRHIGRFYLRQVACQRTVDFGTVMITHLRFFVRLYCRAIVFTLAELRSLVGAYGPRPTAAPCLMSGPRDEQRRWWLHAIDRCEVVLVHCEPDVPPRINVEQWLVERDVAERLHKFDFQLLIADLYRDILA